MSSTPAITGLLEAALYARDLEAAERFYHGLLGMEIVIHVAPRHIFFRAGNAILLVFNPEETVKPPGNPDMPVPPHGAHGPGHVCFEATRAQIVEWRGIFRRADVAIEAEFDWPNGARSLYVRDPAGNSVEFAERRLWFD
ncbi:VOC family protein [Primorskyibacter aestuariivivens]|uniref:VOC family protein n=1 Tax=Primorskyibacter aestuariivivens TaxID=1888912 RepID=UPI0022FFDCEE|nr:VOC family protein [Primorskyibacter aestuariivivens]MDA7430740.1 VOC family protein [Primorskyibacter aestuariivivens]